ncbi:MAG TPA: DNA polymerase I [Microbacteriaceae bacterium]|nr:DNA polymerase I [Microbacteriaceae bacterium]
MPHEKPTLLIIDGHSLAFRAFYALPLDSFVNDEGQHTNAIHGFVAMLISLLKKEKPTHVGVAFDRSRHSFRTREYPAYKGTRGATPPEFLSQIPLLEKVLAAMNIVTVSIDDYEADDIMATLARQGADEGYRVLVVSGDRDAIQLIRDDVTLLYPSVRGVSALKRYDRDAVVERYGVEPGQYPEVAALVGETSDNLVGIAKVGDKTAVKWVQKYGTVDEILAHADEITGVVGRNLREQKENALLNRRLNRLVDDVALPVGPSDFTRRAVDEAALREIFGVLKFRTLLDRVLDLDAPAEGTRAEEGGGAPRPEELRTDKDLAAWLQRVGAPGGAVARPSGGAPGGPATGAEATAPGGFAVVLTVEDAAASDDPARAVTLGAGIADETRCAWLADGGEALAAWLQGADPKTVFDAKAFYTSLDRAGVTPGGTVFDTKITGWLLDPAAPSKDLAGQVRSLLGEELPGPAPEQLLPVPDPAGPGVEAWYLGRVASAIRERLTDGMLRVWEDIERPLTPVLARIEQDGVACDRGVLDALAGELDERAAELARQAYAEIGHEVNLGSPKQLQSVLFDELQMPKTRRNKSGYTTDAAALADLQQSHPHPFLDLLLRHRDATKLRQIVESLRKAVGPDGRIHTTYDQVGTSTGRLSSADPNLQNIPARTPEGRRIRSAFVAGAGYETLLTADYSQIEMRIMAHLSGDDGLIEAFRQGEDLHRYVGSHVFGVAPEDVTAQMRTKVKAMSYGLVYGLSAYGLSRQLHIETAEARRLMAEYFERFGAVRDYLRNVVEQARVDGFTQTIFGRRRFFPDLSSTNRVRRDNAERAALNAPIQGSAADIIKIAMVAIARDMTRQNMGSRMLLQVHDELIFEVAPGEWEALETIVRGRMAGAAELTVPLVVQVGRGADWNSAAH